MDDSINEQEVVTKSLLPTLENFFQLPSVLDTADPILAEIHKLGQSALPNVPVPKMRHENWRFTDINRFFSTKYFGTPTKMTDAYLKEKLAEKIDFTTTNPSELYAIFIDGIFTPSVSSPALTNLDGLTFRTLSTASKTGNAAAEWAELFYYIPDAGKVPRDSYGSDALIALNLLHLEDALHLKVHTGHQIQPLIHLVYVNTVHEETQKMKSSFPRLYLEMEDHASLPLKTTYITIPQEGYQPNVVRVNLPGEDDAAVVETAQPVDKADTLPTMSSQEPATPMIDSKEVSNFLSSHMRIKLGRHALVNHTYIQDLSMKTRAGEVISAEILGDSHYQFHALQAGSYMHRLNMHINLLEENANITLNVAKLTAINQNLDIHSTIDHLSPMTNSNQNERIACGEYSRAVFKGLITVPTIAQKSNAFQLCRSIMLGDHARIQAMPSLEISANDITCSHGVSISDIDENSMFYLAARGIDRQTARKYLVKGFIFGILSEAALSKKDQERIINKLESLNPREEKRDLSMTAQAQFTL